MQINAQIPTGTMAGNSVPLTVEVGGILAQTQVKVAIAE